MEFSLFYHYHCLQAHVRQKLDRELEASIIFKISVDAKTFEVVTAESDDQAESNVNTKADPPQPIPSEETVQTVLQPCPGIHVRGSALLHFEITNHCYEDGCMDKPVIGELFNSFTCVQQLIFQL